MQNHVLISLGHCMALGVIVPVPYYLQEWLQIPNWNKSSADAGRALRKIYCSIEVSARDRAFLIDVIGSTSATNIPEGITSLARNLQLLSAEHPILGED